MKNYNTLDVGKFIACIGIIAIHSEPISANYKFAHFLMAYMTSLCVPFFFTVSSFLFFVRVNEGQIENPLWKFVKRIAILYIVWLLLQSFLLPSKNTAMYSSDFLIKLFFESTFSGSWFYMALIISTSFIFTLRKSYGGGNSCRFNLL